jgi:hypothetical protein
MLDNPNVRALISSVIAGVLAAIVPLQQDLGWDKAAFAFLITALPLLAAQYGTPLNKSVGVGSEALGPDGEPVK